TSLIQQMGRAARNVNALVVMYADQVTPAMQEAIEETERRRAKQLAYNEEHGITPKTIVKAIREGLEVELRARRTAREALRVSEEDYDVEEMVGMLEEEMLTAAQELQFEKAARLRDQMQALRSGKLALGSNGRVRRSEIEEAAADAGRSGGGRKRGGSGGGGKPGMPGVRANKRRKKRQG